MKRIALFLLAAVSLLAQLVGGGITSATVATAGTPVVLSTTNLQVKSFAVQLKSGSATICVGGSNVLASAGTGTCVSGTTNNIFFPPATSLTYDLSKYYVDASSNSTAVSITYNTAQ